MTRLSRRRAWLASTGFAGALFTGAALAAGEQEYLAERRQMVVEIEAMARTTAREVGVARFSDEVMKAMGTVARHRFVPGQSASSAYRNRPLAIGQGQTISQPYIVALSTQLLAPRPDHIVLEIGTGSGYQAAVLAELVQQVYSIEIVEPLGREAAERLDQLEYKNVTVRIGDGYQGWPEKAPFDGIIVTAAAPFIPEPLVAQLKPGGKLVIPVGEPQGAQDLMLIEKAKDGPVQGRVVLPVRFVPLTGMAAEQPKR